MRRIAFIIQLLLVVAQLYAVSPFEFRALCTPSNNNPGAWSIKDTHNVDVDWGLWGHNLYRVVGQDAPEDVYALIEGKRNNKQFCFTSKQLYAMINEWIADQWGEVGQRFSILPADNKLVCQCSRCHAIGCSDSNATPAVADMLTRLARRYPEHQFFMASYHTTTLPPTKPLPDNAGVMLSTMSIPFRYNFYENKGFRTFDDLVKAWQKVSPLLYVWEYNRNFDDYLSPYPCLYVLQERFKYYRNVGIKGVFVNGSGYDYSSFDDVQSYVMAQLLLNPDANVERLVRQFYRMYYPKSGQMIADYYLSLEQRVRQTNHILPYYGTLQEEIESYLNPDEFVSFWKNLDKKSKTLNGVERKRVGDMLTAFAFTRLLLNPSAEEKADLLLILKDYGGVPGLKNYKESSSSLDDFIRTMEGK